MAQFIGADVSRYQGVINWKNFKPFDPEHFIFIKATGGDSVGMYVDPQFGNNLRGARTTHLHRGYYHFGGGHDPIQEAEFFVNHLPALMPGEILVLDSETNASLNPVWAKAFLDHVTARVGFKPLIYMSSSRLFEHDWSAVAKAGYGLWVANYSIPPGGNVPIKYWSFYAFHQFSSTGSLFGIPGNVDHDIFYAPSLDYFSKYGKPAPAPAPVPAPKPTPAPVPAPISPPPVSPPSTPDTPPPPPTEAPVPPIVPEQPATNGSTLKIHILVAIGAVVAAVAAFMAWLHF